MEVNICYTIENLKNGDTLAEQEAANLGRPTKYHDDRPQEILDWFNSHVLEEEAISERIVNSDDEVTKFKFRGAKLPTFEGFGNHIDVHIDTMLEWCKHHAKFSEAYKKCKQIQKDFLFRNAANGNYNTTWSIFFAKCCLGMNDKAAEQENERPTRLVIDFGKDDDEIS